MPPHYAARGGNWSEENRVVDPTGFANRDPHATKDGTVVSHIGSPARWAGLRSAHAVLVWFVLSLGSQL